MFEFIGILAIIGLVIYILSKFINSETHTSTKTSSHFSNPESISLYTFFKSVDKELSIISSNRDKLIAISSNSTLNIEINSTGKKLIYTNDLKKYEWFFNNEESNFKIFEKLKTTLNDNLTLTAAEKEIKFDRICNYFSTLSGDIGNLVLLTNSTRRIDYTSKNKTKHSLNISYHNNVLKFFWMEFSNDFSKSWDFNHNDDLYKIKSDIELTIRYYKKELFI